MKRRTDLFHEFVDLSSHIIEGTPIRFIGEDLTIEAIKKKPPRIKISSETGYIKEIILSKSLLSKMHWKGEPYPICPYWFYHVELLRDILIGSSETQRKGLYFESRCLGASADGGKTIDLPRKRDGSKTVDHERIDDAVERFKRVVKDYNMIVDSQFIQIYSKRPWFDPKQKWDIGIFMEGTLDFISPIEAPECVYEVANIDLKLTSDREICKPYETGNYRVMPWGCPEDLCFTEAMFYRVLFELPFLYMVFDYKKVNPGFKIIPIATDINDPNPELAGKASLRLAELFQVMRWACGQILMWEEEGWPMEPSAVNCKKCPIYECKRRNEIKHV